MSTLTARATASESQGESKKSKLFCEHTFESFACQVLSISSFSIKL